MPAPFDIFISHMPVSDRKDDFVTFWQHSIAEVRAISLDTEMVHDKKQSNKQFQVHSVRFRSHLRSQTSGTLYIPTKKKKPPVIIHVHGYNEAPFCAIQHLSPEAAHFCITLRGHDLIDWQDPERTGSPGYMTENITDPDTYYVKSIFLDVMRSVDMLRLVKDINCAKIGIHGRGFGAAAAIFTAAFSDRIAALVLDSPLFLELPLFQNLSESDVTSEINDFIAQSTGRGQKKKIKDNLTYYDALNFVDRVKCDVVQIAGFKDTFAPPQCAFGFFNRLTTDKSMEIYPEQGHLPGNDTQFLRSQEWLIERISG